MQAHESKYFRFPFWEVVSHTVTLLLQKTVDVAWRCSCYTLTANNAVGNGLQTGTSDILNPRRTATGRQSTIISSATVKRHQEYITSGVKKNMKWYQDKECVACKTKPWCQVINTSLFLFAKPLVQISVSTLHCLVFVPLRASSQSQLLHYMWVFGIP